MTDAEGAGERPSERIRREEEELDFERFGYDTAWEVGSWLVERARRDSLPIAVSIVFGAQRVFHAALPGSSADNDRWLARKIATATAYGASSFRVGAEFRERGEDFERNSTYDVAAHAAHGGAVPIRVRGSVAGVAAVSGLPQEVDHALVMEALRAARDAHA